MKRDTCRPVRGSQTVGRAVQLLKLVGSSRARSLRLIDLAEMASLDKSTAHRLLQRLVYERLLLYSPMHGYRLGPLLFELGLATLPDDDLCESSRNLLITLAEKTGNTISLVRRSGLESVCLSRITGHFPIQTMFRSVGDRHPLGAGVGGLAILASLSDADIPAIITAVRPRLWAYGLTDDALDAAVDATRRRGGLAIDEGRIVRDVTAMGRAIPSDAGAAPAAIFVASLHGRMKGNRGNQVDRLLRECVAGISRRMNRNTA